MLKMLELPIGSRCKKLGVDGIMLYGRIESYGRSSFGDHIEVLWDDGRRWCESPTGPISADKSVQAKEIAVKHPKPSVQILRRFNFDE